MWRWNWRRSQGPRWCSSRLTSATRWERSALGPWIYLLKPFEEARFLVTLERVRAWTAALRAKRTHEHLVALLRQLSETPLAELERLRAPAMPLRFADMEADPATRKVRRAGRLIPLRPKEYDLLAALMQRSGEMVTRRELLAEVWG